MSTPHRIWRVYRSAGGSLYALWEPFRMPRIADEILDCAIYLYPTADDAENGESIGGSGFLVGVPSEVRPGAWYLYAVTNSHVVHPDDGNSPIIRLNTAVGQKEVLARFTTDHWTHHPDGDDIAICPLWLHPEHYRYHFVPRKMFLTKEILDKFNIGPGDDVFMVGRFITHEGKQRNTPSLRFGNIAMMPLEPVLNERGFEQESFLIDARSISGFSGSPVFVYVLPLTKRPRAKGLSRGGGPWLMGVDWGHLPISEPVLEKSGDPADKGWKPVAEGWKVKTNSGMMTVVPVRKLEELLDLEVIAMPRKDQERRLGEQDQREGTAVSDTAVYTKANFEKDLRRVSRRIRKVEPGRGKSKT